MNNNTEKRHIIKDPVYGSMDFSQAEHAFIKPFLDHPLVQRLRHIKQLSFVDLEGGHTKCGFLHLKLAS